MTPHKATPEQWKSTEKWGALSAESASSFDSCLLELRDRIAAIEQQIQAVDATTEQSSAVATPDHFRDTSEMVATDAQLQAVFWPDPKVTGTQGIRAVYDLGRQHGANSSAGLTGSSRLAIPDSSPAPAGGLVERVMAEGYGKTHARAAILAVAAWFDVIGYGATASILRQELQRHG